MTVTIYTRKNILTNYHYTSNAEVGIGLICACLPSASALVARKYRLSTAEENSYDYPRTNSSSTNGTYVDPTFRMSTDTRSNKRRGGSDGSVPGCELMPDQAGLMSYAQSIPRTQTRDSNRRLISFAW